MNIFCSLLQKLYHFSLIYINKEITFPFYFPLVRKDGYQSKVGQMKFNHFKLVYNPLFILFWI